MKKLNYPQLYQKLTKGLSPKVKDIFERRFGVKTGKPETLESIGESFNITRERVRQIEEAGFSVLKKQNKETLDKIFSDFASYFKSKGGFKKEDIALEELGGSKAKPYVLLLLTLGEQFYRVSEKKDFYPFWSIEKNPEAKVSENLDLLVKNISVKRTPLQKKEIFEALGSQMNKEIFNSCLEISKKIQGNYEGKIGLIDWPEIKPRGVKDKSFLVFKKYKKPLHFTKVAELIDTLDSNLPNKKTYPQTVHNELIKDPRFVLVGRGTYALAEWGYEPGTIKDVIINFLKEKKKAQSKDDIIKQVLSQRLVAKNTVLVNLNNSKLFEKNSENKYLLRSTETA